MSTPSPSDVPIEANPIEVRSTLALETVVHAEVDVQITTARRYPRSVRTFIDEALAMAILDEETAAAMFYAIPREGKTIDGPSARLAEVCASAYKNLRVQARVVAEDDQFITARGEAWDIERNVAIAFEVRRRITDKKGKKYSPDMVSVTGNAACSIALRNAIFKIIPSAFTRPIYQKCREVAVGKAETLANKRAAMLGYFLKLGIEESRVLAALQCRGVEDIGLEQLATLRGTATAIKEGDVSVDEAFPAAPASVIPMPARSSEPPAPPLPAERRTCIDRIGDVSQVRDGWTAMTGSGLRIWTRDPALGAALVAAKGQLRQLTAEPADSQGRRKLLTLTEE